MSDTRSCSVSSFQSIALGVVGELSEDKHLGYPLKFNVASDKTEAGSLLIATPYGIGTILAIACLKNGTFLMYHASIHFDFMEPDHPYVRFCAQVKENGGKVFLLQKNTDKHTYVVPLLADNLLKSLNDSGVEKIEIVIAKLKNYRTVICDSRSKTIWATENLIINSVADEKAMIVTPTPGEENPVILETRKLPEARQEILRQLQPASPKSQETSLPSPGQLRSQSPKPQSPKQPQPPKRSASHSRFSFHFPKLFTHTDSSHGGVDVPRKKSAGGGGF